MKLRCSSDESRYPILGSRYNMNLYSFGLPTPSWGPVKTYNFGFSHPILGSRYNMNLSSFGVLSLNCILAYLLTCLLAYLFICLLAYLPRFLHGRPNCPVMWHCGGLNLFLGLFLPVIPSFPLSFILQNIWMKWTHCTVQLYTTALA